MQNRVVIARYSGFWCGMRMLLVVPLLFMLWGVRGAAISTGAENPDLLTWGVIGLLVLFIVLSICLPIRLIILRNAIWIEGKELFTAGPVRARIRLDEITRVQTYKRWVMPFYNIRTIQLYRTSAKTLHFELHCVNEDCEDIAARIKDAIEQAGRPAIP